MLLSFYPGPSKVYPQISAYLQDAYASGVLSIPHRGTAFEQLSRETVELLRARLNIPLDYQVFFTSSATECWEIILQSLVNKRSHHFYNGAFGEKWYKIARLLGLEASCTPFEVDTNPFELSNTVANGTELICLTHNETSNGTQLPADFLLKIRAEHQQALIAVDATSSMGGVQLRFNKADVWFASVQKCFGMPAGLGLLICSPRTLERARALNHNRFYNSLTVIAERMLNYQTYNTPNVLGIYLLNRILQQTTSTRLTDTLLNESSRQLYLDLRVFEQFKPLVTNECMRSATVLAFSAEERVCVRIRNLAQKNGLDLGKGYGRWARTTFRIANFPQHEAADFEQLLTFLHSIQKQL